MKRFILFIPVVVSWSFIGVSCMKYSLFDKEDLQISERELFITNEGNFQYGNATLSYYDPESRLVENEIFVRDNGKKLGDVAQSMSIHDRKGYVVVNNSGVVYVIDLNTFEVLGGIKELTFPRYIHFISDKKVYIRDLYAPVITVFNPQNLEKTGYIDTKGHNFTEQMVQYGKFAFTNC